MSGEAKPNCFCSYRNDASTILFFCVWYEDCYISKCNDGLAIYVLENIEYIPA